MDKTRKLLEFGYFPVQLPPAFNTRSFAKYHKVIAKAWTKATAFKQSKGEIFSVARAGHRRRMTSIQNPTAQYYCAKEVETHWKSLVKHYKKSPLSLSTPKFKEAERRAIQMTPLHALHEEKIKRSAGFKFMLQTDISRFFPTIYTHSIPWALHGKSVAKANRKNSLMGNALDGAFRRGQDGQTIGIPIGPDTSHITAEVIATAVDVEIKKALKKWPAGFRYVDDYYLFFEGHIEAESALAAIGRAMQVYELQINFEKTKISKVHEISEDSWTHRLRSFNIADSGKKQRSDLNHFFDFALELGHQFVDESVIKYALRKVSATVIRRENWSLFEAHLCRLAVGYPHALQNIARILATYHLYGYPLCAEAIGRFCNAIVIEQASLGHHSEVAWSLWICKELKLRVNRKSVDAVAKMHSSVCALILLDLFESKLTAKAPSTHYWKQFMSSDALYGDLWLLAYEGEVQHWLPAAKSHVSNDLFFKELSSRDVRFYDKGAKLPPLFTVKPGADAAEIFSDSFRDLDGLIEFEDEESEYGDSPSTESSSEDDSDVSPDEWMQE